MNDTEMIDAPPAYQKPPLSSPLPLYQSRRARNRQRGTRRGSEEFQEKVILEEVMPERVSERAPEQAPEQAPAGVSEKVPEEVPEVDPEAGVRELPSRMNARDILWGFVQFQPHSNNSFAFTINQYNSN